MGKGKDKDKDKGKRHLLKRLFHRQSGSSSAQTADDAAGPSRSRASSRQTESALTVGRVVPETHNGASAGSGAAYSITSPVRREGLPLQNLFNSSLQPGGSLSGRSEPEGPMSDCELRLELRQIWQINEDEVGQLMRLNRNEFRLALQFQKVGIGPNAFNQCIDYILSCFPALPPSEMEKQDTMLPVNQAHKRLRDENSSNPNLEHQDQTSDDDATMKIIKKSAKVQHDDSILSSSPISSRVPTEAAHDSAEEQSGPSQPFQTACKYAFPIRLKNGDAFLSCGHFIRYPCTKKCVETWYRRKLPRSVLFLNNECYYCDRLRTFDKLSCLQTCEVCDEIRTASNFPTATGTCSHKALTCGPCMQGWLLSQANSKGMDMVSCSHCSEKLAHHDLKRLLPISEFERLDKLAATAALSSLPGFRWCTNKDCSSGQIHDGGTDSPLFRCTSCNDIKCINHENPVAPHPDETCVQYDENYSEAARKKRADQERASDALLKKETKPCPNPECGIHCQKERGCDHMRCTKCKHEFCWICLEPYAQILRDNSYHLATCKWHSQNIR